MEEIAGIGQYSTGRAARSEREAPHIDRARGGTVTITLVIPPKQIGVQGGGGGVVNIPQQSVTFTIDMEQLPLVNVANYSAPYTQIGPPALPYPAALPSGAAPLTHTFG
jgi:hypothetical protein